jgi:hypothetical protein
MRKLAALPLMGIMIVVCRFRKLTNKLPALLALGLLLSEFH